MSEHNEGCKKCTGETECIISISTPGFWIKVKIENGELVVAFDLIKHGMRTVAPLNCCPFCGKALKK